MQDGNSIGQENAETIQISDENLFTLPLQEGADLEQLTYERQL